MVEQLVLNEASDEILNCKVENEVPDLFIEGVTEIDTEEAKKCLVSNEECEDVMDGNKESREFYCIPTFGVNKTSDTRNVRSGAGTNYSVVAKMTGKESFVFTGQKKYVGGYDWWQILITSSILGGYQRGWYQGFTGAGFWHNNSLGTGSQAGNGFRETYCIFDVKSTVNVYKRAYGFPNDVFHTLRAGDRVYGTRKSGGYMVSEGSNGCEDYMEIWGWRKDGSIRWAFEFPSMSPSGNEIPGTFYVKTGLRQGVTRVRGKW